MADPSSYQGGIFGGLGYKPLGWPSQGAGGSILGRRMDPSQGAGAAPSTPSQPPGIPPGVGAGGVQNSVGNPATPFNAVNTIPGAFSVLDGKAFVKP